MSIRSRPSGSFRKAEADYRQTFPHSPEAVFRYTMFSSPPGSGLPSGESGKAADKVIDGAGGKAYNSGSHLKLLRGWVKFPTGGIARELSRKPSRSGDDSGADSTVWMREETDSIFHAYA